MSDTYDFDVNVDNPENLIHDEVHTLGGINGVDVYTLVPKNAPFFNKDLEVEDSQGQPMVEGLDYTLTHRQDQLSRAFPEVEVYKSITLTDPTRTGNVTLKQYRTIGGDLVDNRDAEIITAFQATVSAQMDASWVDIPLTLPPTPHTHPLDGIGGIAYWIESIYGVRDSINSMDRNISISDISDLGSEFIEPVIQSLKDINLSLVSQNQIGDSYNYLNAKLNELSGGTGSTSGSGASGTGPSTIIGSTDISSMRTKTKPHLAGHWSKRAFNMDLASRKGTTHIPAVMNDSLVNDHLDLPSLLTHMHGKADVEWFSYLNLAVSAICIDNNGDLLVGYTTTAGANGGGVNNAFGSNGNLITRHRVINHNNASRTNHSPMQVNIEEALESLVIDRSPIEFWVLPFRRISNTKGSYVHPTELKSTTTGISVDENNNIFVMQNSVVHEISTALTIAIEAYKSTNSLTDSTYHNQLESFVQDLMENDKANTRKLMGFELEQLFLESNGVDVSSYESSIPDYTQTTDYHAKTAIMLLGEGNNPDGLSFMPDGMGVGSHFMAYDGYESVDNVNDDGIDGIRFVTGGNSFTLAQNIPAYNYGLTYAHGHLYYASANRVDEPYLDLNNTVVLEDLNPKLYALDVSDYKASTGTNIVMTGGADAVTVGNEGLKVYESNRTDEKVDLSLVSNGYLTSPDAQDSAMVLVDFVVLPSKGPTVPTDALTPSSIESRSTSFDPFQLEQEAHFLLMNTAFPTLNQHRVSMGYSTNEEMMQANGYPNYISSNSVTGVGLAKETQGAWMIGTFKHFNYTPGVSHNSIFTNKPTSIGVIAPWGELVSLTTMVSAYNSMKNFHDILTQYPFYDKDGDSRKSRYSKQNISLIPGTGSLLTYMNKRHQDNVGAGHGVDIITLVGAVIECDGIGELVARGEVVVATGNDGKQQEFTVSMIYDKDKIGVIEPWLLSADDLPEPFLNDTADLRSTGVVTFTRKSNPNDKVILDGTTNTIKYKNSNVTDRCLSIWGAGSIKL